MIANIILIIICFCAVAAPIIAVYNSPNLKEVKDGLD